MPIRMRPQNGLREWLRERVVRKGQGKSITHTRIGSKTRQISGGSYHILESELPEFNQLYHQHVFVDGHLEYLTETQRHVGPLLIDLDFRYEQGTTERQHTEAHLFDIVEVFVNILKDMLVLDDEKIPHFDVWVMEKPDPNPQPELTKDGVHIIFGLAVDRATRKMIRDQALYDLEDVLEDLPLISTSKTDTIMETTLDKGVALGTCQWQMYGSRKPGNDVYRVVKAYRVSNGGNTIELAPGSVSGHQAILAGASARSLNVPNPKLQEEWKEKHETTTAALLAGKKEPAEETLAVLQGDEALPGSVPSGGVSVYTPRVISQGPNIVGQPLTEIRLQVETMLDELPFHEAHLRDAHENAMALGPEYYNPRDAWLRVGWALRNTSNKLFGSWVMFSSRSSKFKLSDVPEMKQTWDTSQSDGKTPLTDRSLAYWCRTSNPDEYERLRQSSIGEAMESSLNGQTEFDVANVLYRIFNGEYRCASIKFRVWYKFTGHYWKRIDEGTDLRMQISQHLSPMYRKEVDKLHTMLASMDETNEAYDRIKKKARSYNNIAVNLKKTAYKNNVMRECCELFYDRDFLDRLDMNPMLLGCENGVVDFEKGCFREGLPDDYVSTTTGLMYDESALDSEAMAPIRSEIENFMKMLFTEPAKREYMWEHLSAVLIGTNDNQLFNIYNGEGSNGKSKLVELMTETLGAYKGVVPVSLVTSKRTTIGGVSPEIAKLKPCRYAVMQEPSKGDTLNEGILKELTGGDPIVGRGLYQDSVEYVPQFSLAVCCNQMFQIKSDDHGTWRRMGVVNYTSCFMEDPDPDNPLQFKKEKKLAMRFKTWAPVMLVMLANRAFKNKGEVTLCEEVKLASNKYRSSQDHIAEFLEERISVREGSLLRKQHVQEEFKAWHSSLYGGRAPGTSDVFKQITKKYGEFNKKAGGWCNAVLSYGETPQMVMEQM